MGSIFSIEQIIITLSLGSRINSNSYSFQPNKYSSTNTWPVGLSFNPSPIDSSNSFSLYATEPPEPPRVKDGLIIAGKEILSRSSFPSSID